MNYEIKCDVNNLIEVRDKMLTTAEELIKKLDDTLRELEDSKVVYDTPTATYIREQCDNIISVGKNYISDTIIPSIHRLDISIQEYNGFLADTKRTVTGGDSE
jgi:hypothetical protein